MISKHFDNEDFELFVVMCWAIWSEACKRNHDLLDHKREIRIDWVSSFLETFRQNGKVYSTRIVSTKIVGQCWTPPAPYILRLDVDAGFDEVRNMFSVGAVIIDDKGKVLGALARVIHHPGMVKAAKLCAIRYGMEFYLKLGFKEVGIFSYSIQAVQAINSSVVDLSPNGVLTMDILNMLESDAFFSINHMPRSANRAAHRLAREASDISSCVEWCNDDIPSWLINTVNQDILKKCRRIT